MLGGDSGKCESHRPIDARLRQAVLHRQRPREHRGSLSPEPLHSSRVAFGPQTDLQHHKRQRLRGIRSGLQHR